MVDHEIEQDPNVPLLRFGQKPVEIRHGAELRIDALIIGNVVAEIDLGRREKRRDPDTVHAEFFQIIEVPGDAIEVADAVPVGVAEAPGIDLVQHRVAPPVRRCRGLLGEARCGDDRENARGAEKGTHRRFQIYTARPAALALLSWRWMIYAERLARRAEALQSFEVLKNRIGYLRLLTMAGVVAAIWWAVQGAVNGWWIAAPVLVFIALLTWQSRVERRAELVRRAIRFYEAGIARMEGRWQGIGEAGERFVDPHHPYSADLDLFGKGSLFHLLSTARTTGGAARLASWLKGSAPVEELRERHAAIVELRPLIDLREELAVLGDEYRVGVDPEELARWAGTPAHPFSAALRVSAFLLAVCAAGVLLWWFSTSFIGIAARRAVIALIVVEGSVLLQIRQRLKGIVSGIGEPARDLQLLSQMLGTLEKQSFASPRLKALGAALKVQGMPASKRIAKLRRLMELLDSRDNFLVRILDGPFLYTLQVAMAIEGWHAANGRYIAGWLDAVAEIEALSSLANYSFEHPEDPFPAFEEGAVFDGEGLGHPLLPDAGCVRNSVALRSPLRLYVVSGSNMSGKSTLLRAVGINAVLALAGAPVRARRLAISRVSVGASIRTMDSLEEGHSRFMAEILRLKQILELPEPALFLLDELLGGTNSHDRAIGAEGLVRSLLAKGAIGLATTHDLSLSRVADDLAPNALNVHFEDRLERTDKGVGRLVFDYRMRDGVVTRSNALDLMRAVGLDV